MISDVLYDARKSIEEYRTDPTTAECYSHPKMAAKLDRLTAAMQRLQAELDAPPKIAKPWVNGRSGRG